MRRVSLALGLAASYDASSLTSAVSTNQGLSRIEGAVATLPPLWHHPTSCFRWPEKAPAFECVTRTVLRFQSRLQCGWMRTMTCGVQHCLVSYCLVSIMDTSRFPFPRLERYDYVGSCRALVRILPPGGLSRSCRSRARSYNVPLSCQNHVPLGVIATSGLINGFYRSDFVEFCWYGFVNPTFTPG